MKSFFRTPEKESDRAASNLLAALDAHHPLPFTAYLQELAQGIPPAEVGAAIGQALAERERLYERTQQEKEHWQEQAKSYRLAWERARQTDELGEAKKRITALEAQLAEENALAERQKEYLAYLKQEKERLDGLVALQNEIIARQQVQLTALEENEL
jgi:hypothetical protein